MWARLFPCADRRRSNKLYRPPLVRNPQIQSATLHNPLPLFLHTYIWPFLAIWPAFFAVYLSEARYNTYIAGSEWTFVWAGSIFTLQSLTWLMTKWNVNLDSLFTSTTAKDVGSAKLIKVIPITNAGAAEICKLLRENVSSTGGPSSKTSNEGNRLAENKKHHSTSRSAGSITMLNTTVLRLSPMTSTKSLDQTLKSSKNRMA